VPNVGLSELIVILMILLLVFGASRLPQIGESLGRTVRSFKRGAGMDDAPASKLPESPSASRSPANDEISDAEIVDKKS
jgi:sec-independent protein translocase protein TatA